MAKKKKRTMTAEGYLELDPQERHEQTMRKLAERIVYHDTRGERMTADDYLKLDPQERHEQTMRKLAERIVYHEAKAEEERAARRKRAAG